MGSCAPTLCDDPRWSNPSLSHESLNDPRTCHVSTAFGLTPSGVTSQPSTCIT